MNDPLAPLRDPATIRLRCAAITRAVDEGRSGHFFLRRERIAEVAERVVAVTRAAYPALNIPYHSRWRHFEAGGVNRRAELEGALVTRDALQAARARIDLTVVSVLLDAGAGAGWKFTEGGSGGTSFVRSEGLGVASFRAFMEGRFSADEADSLRVDAAALRRLDAGALRAIFQASPSNPLVGVEGRVALLNRLGDVLAEAALLRGGEARPGRLLDDLGLVAGGALKDAASVSATQLLDELLRAYMPIWPSGGRVLALPVGDAWPHLWAGAETAIGPHRTTGGCVPFHKLSQWLSYSLLEPLQWAGIEVSGIDALTGLPEYRNGGLLLDGGVIVPRDARDLGRSWKPSDEFIIEWRALTVSLLDDVAAAVRQQLGLTAQQMPLACVLEGGTWAAGRQIASEKREGGVPPLVITSDGTVF